MTRAEATARVVAAAKRVVALIDARAEMDDLWLRNRIDALRQAIHTYDACPPEDAVDVLGIAVPRDLHDARALAWAGWQEIFRLREQVAPWAWDRAFLLEDDGTWPTRDAEHAAWAGRYRAREGGGQTGGDTESPELAATPAPSGPEVVAGGDECPRCGAPPDIDFVERYHRCQCCNLKLPQPAPAPAQSAAFVPGSGFTLEQVTLEVSGIAKRLAALETAVMERECVEVGIRTAASIDGERLDALAAQVGRRLDAVEQRTAQMQRALRAMLTRTDEYQLPISQETAWRNALTILNDGGPDAHA